PQGGQLFHRQQVLYLPPQRLSKRRLAPDRAHASGGQAQGPDHRRIWTDGQLRLRALPQPVHLLRRLQPTEVIPMRTASTIAFALVLIFGSGEVFASRRPDPALCQKKKKKRKKKVEPEETEKTEKTEEAEGSEASEEPKNGEGGSEAAPSPED